MSDRSPDAPAPAQPQHQAPAANPPGTIDRREFLRGLGGGLLVCCWTQGRHSQALAQEAPTWETRPAAGAVQPRAISAWLHVGAGGTVTVFTGKVEIGQNVRTSLAQVVAEELRVPIASVLMIMGDTALVPFDNGTFASQTTPIMGLQLRKAASSARQILLEKAALKLQVEKEALILKEGKFLHEPTGRALAFGELTEGQEFVEDMPEESELTPADRWTIAGTSVPKLFAESFVTGGHRFASDLKRPGMWHGKVLRPPAYGLKLASADTQAAKGKEGVVVLQDGDFLGVAAQSEELAAEAIASIAAQWEGNPVAGSDRDILTQLKESAQRDTPHESRQTRGNLEEGKAQAALTISQTYSVAYIAHCALEPRAAVAEWNGDHLTVWTGTQRPFGIRNDLMRVFGIDASKIRVFVPSTGSGYGSKHSGEMEVEAARLAKAAGRPVKVAWTREEEFTWAYFRPAGLVEAMGAASKDGRLLAWEFHNINSGTAGLPIPYDVPNSLVEFHPARSPLRQGAYRALASTMNHFARESLIDELARGLGMDPLALRLKNISDERLQKTLLAAAEKFGWDASARPGEGRGFGMACGAEKGACIATMAEVAVEGPARRVRVVRAVTAFQPGAIVNPDQMANQVEGALVMGIGGALFESIRFQDGKLRNASFTSYRLPRFSDTPKIDVVLLDRKDILPSGGGEIPIVGIAPALANAIHHATGLRLRNLPLAPGGRLPTV